MRARRLAALAAAWLGATPALGGRARADEAPLLAHAGAGAAFGAGVGLGGGYLVARPDGWEGGGDWRTLGIGAGAGALGGGLLGLGVGALDRARHPDRRWPVLFGAMGLTLDGAVLGAVGGGIAALVKQDKEQVLHGAAIGAIAGGGVGLAAALWATFAGSSAAAASDGGARVRPGSTLTLLVAPARSGTWLPTLAGRY